jgi:alpha-beta hydrolase superfamily lysophospholipase
MSHVVSADGTAIAYERVGSGPAVVLVGGGLDDGAENAPLAAALAERFTVVNYARRGRGESGDTLPYAVQREIEDIDALIAEAGGAADVYGISSGGALALAAAAAGSAIERIAVYEVPWNVDPGWPARWRAYTDELDAMLAAGRRGDAVARFMRLADMPDEAIAGARGAPVWPALEAVAHTLAYDAACLGSGQPPAEQLARITQPALVATGTGHGPAAAGWERALDGAADAIAASLPHAERRALAGQSHVVDASVLAPVLAEFFAGSA